VHDRIETHFRTVSADLPFWKRVKSTHIWEGDLPKTAATRKVKRREIVAELQRLKKSESEGALVAAAPPEEAGIGWLLDLVAQVSGKPRAEVHARSRLDQLGFDSLMYTELGAALEGAVIALPETTDFTGVTDVRELHRLVRGAGPAAPEGTGTGPRPASTKAAAGADTDLYVPGPIARVGKRGLAVAQRLFYQRLLESKVSGQGHVPLHTNFIVASNHCSHLDMGLVKVALGEAGREITSMAAADYFFRNRYRRAYFTNFTNLVPMERTGSIRKSMATAEQVLRQGKSMVIFPEGTRSLDGKMADFLPSLGYLALRSGVGLLPAHIGGTYESMPKGAALPRTRQLMVAFGPFLGIDALNELTAGLPHQESWRLIAALTQRIVENLRDGVAVRLDLAAARAGWNGQTLAPGAEQRPPAPKRPLLSSVPG
jgi:long-chain acyl-CoA synthetase